MNLDFEKAKIFRVEGYELVRRLGTGARSAIWEAREKNSAQSIAVKRTFMAHGDDDRFLHQAVNEYDIGSRLKHPSIRRMFSIQKERKLFRLKEVHTLMELAPGESLVKHPPKDLLEACTIFLQVAQALHEMNQRGFVHADMKPENIIVNGHNTAKVIDLGLSCPVGTTKTRIQGTPECMAPEQLVRRPITPRTDVYNFGATMYWALAGEFPPTILPERRRFAVSGQKIVTPPHEVNSDIPYQLSRTVMDCIQVEPSARLDGLDTVAGRLVLALRDLEKNPQANKILPSKKATEPDPS